MNAGTDFSRPGLMRYEVGAKDAEAAAMVELLHDFSDFINSPGGIAGTPKLKEVLADAALMLDECRAGWNVFHPQPHSGWVLVPATVIPKVAAAVEALIAAQDGDDVDRAMAKSGGDAVLLLVKEGWE